MHSLLRRVGCSNASWLPPRPSTSTRSISSVKKAWQEFSDAQIQPDLGNTSTDEQARLRAVESNKGNVFDQVLKAAKQQNPKFQQKKPTQKPKATEHRYSTARFHISARKLNELSRLVARMPVDQAILQMQLSDKKASGRILSTLALARDHAMKKGLSRERLIVDETWVAKGKSLKRIDFRARGKMGIKEKRSSRMHVILREGPSPEEAGLKQAQKKMKQQLRASLIHGAYPQMPQKPVINRGLTRGVGFV